MIITEKIDGTNAAVLIDRKYVPSTAKAGDIINGGIIVELFPDDLTPTLVWVGAQSRKQLITPEKDNFGFAAYVRENAWRLVALLGEGRHFGEWWGSGIQRGYGLEKAEKRFSVFNIKRYSSLNDLPAAKDIGLATVPVLDEYTFSAERANQVVNALRHTGSYASPGFDRPEGIIVFHVAGNHLYKVLLENDEGYKGNSE
jgi:hypothetical protein